MKKITLLSSMIFAMLLVSFTGNAQVDLDCGDVFVDSGDVAANYSSDETITYTICPTSGDAGDVVYVDFSAFSTENSGAGCWDGLTIYDGADITATTIDPPAGGTIWCWDRADATPNGSGDLQGMTIISSDASGCLTFVFTSDGSVTRAGWEAAVTCGPPPTCVAAEGTATVGVTDCGGADTFSIDVDVTSLGNAATVTISNDGGVASTDVTATGIVSVGPFTSGSNVNISLDHDADPLCNADLPSVTFACPITNDECDDAIALTVNSDLACGSVTFGTIEGATASGVDDTACGGTEDDDVWFSFVAAATTHNISLINVANGTTDLYHSVWSGACGALTNLSCSDPNTSTITGLTIGDTYLLRVYSWTSTAGQTSTFDVCIGTPPPPPANDDCGGAEALTIPVAASCPGNTVTSTADATEGADELPTCDTFGNFGLWYSFIAPASGQMEFVSGAGSPGIVIYEGACGTLTEISGTCINNNSGSIAGLTPGNPYFAMISTDAAETNVEFCLYSLSCAAAEATTTAVAACATGEFTIDVDVTSLGSSTTVTVANDSGVASTDVTATGVVNVGPFTSGTDVVITLLNDTDMACDVDLPLVSFSCPPANDDCAGAQMVTQETNIVDAGSATPVLGTLEGSTDSGLPAEECNGFTGTANDDVWYSFEALTSNVTITTDDDVQAVDLVVILYSGACGTLVVEGCDDSGNPEEISATGLTVGDTYYFRVFQYGVGSTVGDNIIVKVWSSDTLGTDDFETENAFSYFPNPVKGELTLHAQNNIQNVSVYNMLGQEVLRTAPNTVDSTISMSALSQGAYFVRVTIGNVTETIRIIKQ